MPLILTVVLPLPPAGLQTNRASSSHWSKLSPLRRKYRADARLAARAAMNAAGLRRPPLLASATLQATFYLRTKRRRDKDNALNWIKNGIDALADVGIVRNDSEFIPLPVRLIAPATDPRVEIVIEETTETE